MAREIFRQALTDGNFVVSLISEIKDGNFSAAQNDKNILSKKNVLVIGPGLGKNFDCGIILELIRKFNGPIIVDADAISNFDINIHRIFSMNRFQGTISVSGRNLKNVSQELNGVSIYDRRFILNVMMRYK